MRLCNEFVPDAGLITACMQKKRRQLSPECAAEFNWSGGGPRVSTLDWARRQPRRSEGLV